MVNASWTGRTSRISPYGTALLLLFNLAAVLNGAVTEESDKPQQLKVIFFIFLLFLDGLCHRYCHKAMLLLKRPISSDLSTLI